ncbi:MAG: LacI family transcriptional regulator [Bacteroidales bacterium]|jgi:DNA-binding LacI/PurR family transcriptional regulator|nr:LacI family transcriptional regulator [Bacteroidales bacterium]
MKRTSLKSIAAATGVSKTTASFVLNGKGNQHKINQATQERIIKEARQQNYQPSFLAQTLSLGKTMTIGLLLPHTEDSLANSLLHHLVPELQLLSYRLLPGIAPAPNFGEREIIDDFILRQTDAIVAVKPLHENVWAGSLSILQTPLVIVSGKEGGSTPITINHDYTQIINLLIQRHFQHHKKAIGYIGRARDNNLQLQAYLSCYIDRFDISSTYHYLLKEAEPVASALKALIQESVNAIIFESPEMAGHAINYIQNNHLAKIENISLSCIGWNPELAFAQPKVQGVDYNYSKLAKHISHIIRAALTQQPATSQLGNDTLYQLFPKN